MVKVEPSLLAANFLRLDSEIDRMIAAGADALHYDVMDGEFVQEISFGQMLLRQIAGRKNLPVDVHMMVRNPEKQIESFAESGASTITVHAETTPDICAILRRIRECGCQAGITVNPTTSEARIFDAIGEFDLALIMTVQPGKGGQKMLPGMLEKVRSVRKKFDETHCPALIQVDGGVNRETAPALIASGADILVTGSALFKAPDAAAFIREIKAAGR